LRKRKDKDPPLGQRALKLKLTYKNYKKVPPRKNLNDEIAHGFGEKII
jgi:hypothetical protein